MGGLELLQVSVLMAGFGGINVLLIVNYLSTIFGVCISSEVIFKDTTPLPLTKLGTTMEELERLNKELKSVKTEVKEKQKRLSKFTLTLELLQSHIASLSDTNLRQDFLEYNSLLPKEKWDELSKNTESA